MRQDRLVVRLADLDVYGVEKRDASSLWHASSMKISSIIPAVGWAIVVLWVGYAAFAPASLWISSATLDVEDSTVGVSPAVKLYVDYQKQMFVHWHRGLIRTADDEVICGLEGADEAYSGSQTSHTTINDLFEDSPCAKSLSPGDYSVEIVLEWSDIVARSLPIESNIFTVHPAVRAVRPTPPAITAPIPEGRVRHYRAHPASSLPWPLSLLVHSAR